MKNEILRAVIWTSDDLQIVTDKNNYFYKPEGDCCSESFIVHIDEPPRFEGTILSEELEIVKMPPSNYDQFKGTQEPWVFKNWSISLASLILMPSTSAICSIFAFRNRASEPKAASRRSLRTRLMPGQSSSTLSLIRRFINNW